MACSCRGNKTVHRPPVLPLLVFYLRKSKEKESRGKKEDKEGCKVASDQSCQVQERVTVPDNRNTAC